MVIIITNTKYKLGILGLGNMGSVLLKAIINNNIVSAEKIIIYDILDELNEKYTKSVSVTVANDEIDLFLKSENILIAIKPQFLSKTVEKINSNIPKDKNIEDLIKSKMIISIAAGKPISFYEKGFGKELAVVRIMPNILAVVNEAASALTRNNNVSDEQFEFVLSIFNKIGTTVQVKEHLMDVVTGMSGSGPAFIAILVEAMADGAVKLGMPRDVAYKLAAQTIKGTGEMLLKTKMHPGVMKDMVSSPGGTTITGIHALERNGFRNTIMNAIEAASLRSEALNNNNKK